MQATDAEHQMLRNLAEDAGLSMSDYVRQLIRSEHQKLGRRDPRVAREAQSLRVELIRELVIKSGESNPDPDTLREVAELMDYDLTKSLDEVRHQAEAWLSRGWCLQDMHDALLVGARDVFAGEAALHRASYESIADFNRRNRENGYGLLDTIDKLV